MLSYLPHTQQSAISSGYPTKSLATKAEWTMSDGEFAEPIESSTDAGKVVSQRQPPGWLSGRVWITSRGVLTS